MTGECAGDAVGYQAVLPEACSAPSVWPLVAAVAAALAFVGLMFLFARLVARYPGLVPAWSFQPKPCCEDRTFSSGSVKWFSYVALILMCLALVPPTATAAPPDTPPTLSWSLDRECVNTSLYATNQADKNAISTDSAGNVYIFWGCRRASVSTPQQQPMVTKITSDGAVVWQSDESEIAINADGPGGQRSGIRAAGVGPDDRPFLEWIDEDGATVPFKWAFLNATSGLVQASGGNSFFTGASDLQDSFGKAVGFKTVNNTTMQVFVGGSGGDRWAMTCTNTDAANCTKDWEVTGGNDGAMRLHYGGPYNTNLYGYDGETGSVEALTRISTSDGTDAANSGDLTDNEGFIPWVAENGTSIYWAHLDSGGTGANGVRMTERNSDTLAAIRTINPTDNKPAGFDDVGSAEDMARRSSSYLDGDDNLFWCGRSTTGGEQASTVMKFNTTAAAGQRWNLTFNVTTVGTEGAIDCTLGPDGSLYVLAYGCTGSFTGCKLQVRKYAGAGTQRNQQTAVDFGDSSSAPVVTTDAAAGLRNFCTALGFESEASLFLCGLIFALVATVVMVASVAGVTKGQAGSQVLGVTGGLTFMSFGIFNAVSEIWNTGYLVVLAIIAAAVVTVIVRRTFGGQEGG